MVILSEERINYDEILTRVNVSNVGSVVVHYALVKSSVEGKRTAGIRFFAKGDLEGELREIETHIRNTWAIDDCLIVRRLGDLKTGDIIMAVAVSAEGRDAAFQGCREAVEKCKKLKNLSKEELYI